jgi:hypothetical protein
MSACVFHCDFLVFQFGYYRCDCPNNYAGQQCNRYCSQTLDVAVVLDLSGGIDTSVPMLSMVRTLLSGLPINAQQVHVSVVTYSDSPNVLFYLKDFSSPQQVGQKFKLLLSLKDF